MRPEIPYPKRDPNAPPAPHPEDIGLLAGRGTTKEQTNRPTPFSPSAYREKMLTELSELKDTIGAAREEARLPAVQSSMLTF